MSVRDTPEPERRALVTVVGSINVDVVLGVSRHPLPGETLIAESMDVHPGGKGANQAVAAARLGASVAFVGAVGTDAYAELAVSGMKEAGVDISGVAVAAGATGQAFVTVDGRTGENSILVLPGANAHVDEVLVLGSVGLLARSDIILLQGEIPSEAAAAAASACTGRLILNLAPVIALERRVIQRANPLVVNEHEGRLALKLLGREGRELHTAESVVEALLEEGMPAVVLTLGSEGAVFSEGGAVRRVRAPVVAAADTTGAGDAFVGALAARLADDASLEEAVRFGVRVGSFAVTRPGAQPSYPWHGDDLPGATP